MPDIQNKQTSQQPARYLTKSPGTTAKFTYNINHPVSQESFSLVPSNGINTNKRNKTCCQHRIFTTEYPAGV